MRARNEEKKKKGERKGEEESLCRRRPREVGGGKGGEEGMSSPIKTTAVVKELPCLEQARRRIPRRPYPCCGSGVECNHMRQQRRWAQPRLWRASGTHALPYRAPWTNPWKFTGRRWQSSPSRAPPERLASPGRNVGGFATERPAPPRGITCLLQLACVYAGRSTSGDDGWPTLRQASVPYGIGRIKW